jgi:hypothetical protein
LELNKFKIEKGYEKVLAEAYADHIRKIYKDKEHSGSARYDLKE